MIPHITQERRAENNIHHTGRIKGIVMQKRCEEMTGPSAASLITCVSSDWRGPKRLQGPTRCTSDVMTSTPDSPIGLLHLSPTLEKINPVDVCGWQSFRMQMLMCCFLKKMLFPLVFKMFFIFKYFYSDIHWYRKVIMLCTKVKWFHSCRFVLM